MNELQSLIKKTEQKNKQSSFTVATRPSLDEGYVLHHYL